MANKNYKVPLKKIHKYPRRVRTKKAVKKLKNFLRRHTKSNNVKIGKELNELLWSRGNQKPPSSVEVSVSEVGGEVYCNVPGKEISKEEVKEKFTCDKCGEAFDSERGLKIHKSQAHRDEEEEEGEEKEEEKEDLYTCPECGKEFETKRGLSIHKSQQHPEEESKEDLEGLLGGTISEAKKKINDMDNPDYDKLLKIEKNNKDRKGMKSFLEGKLED
ncbi:MAG: 50S ribosomal protein L31e [Candidatus Aenigmatarchaeota archaeon]